MPSNLLPAPLVLGSSLTITRGQSLQFAAVNLAPKVTVPYEVSAIRMSAYAAAALNATGEPGQPPDMSLRGFLRWSFTLGGIGGLALTDSFVPMWNLTPVRQQITESGGYFEWRFDRPLVISPAARIDARVQLDTSTPNLAGAPTITAAVAYAGRLRPDLDTVPAMIDVPFCSCWDTTQTGGNTANDWDSLRNPLKAAVEVKELICRVENQTTGLNGDDSKELQIFDPFGRALHRNGTIQIHAMFPSDTRSFPYVGILETDQHFAVRLNDVPSATYRPMISYLGSRRERSL